jgi:hypothetical protein
MNKKGQIRWGNLDAISAILFLVGIFTLKENSLAGLILIVLGIIKQFSGR